MTTLAEMTGMDAEMARQLNTIGIETAADLLERGATREGRAAISDATGINQLALLPWLYRADLERVKGVSTDQAALLAAAGVSTVPDLAYRKPEELHPKLAATNKEHSLVKRAPTLAQVRNWIEHAGTLPALITFPGAEVF